MDMKALLSELNKALALEYRSFIMYGHYSEFIKGLEGGWLVEKFKEEAEESSGHVEKVRSVIVALGGIPTTKISEKEVKHTENIREMLKHAHENEKTAAELYKKILPHLKTHDHLFHKIYHILMSEQESQLEFERLLSK